MLSGTNNLAQGAFIEGIMDIHFGVVKKDWTSLA